MRMGALKLTCLHCLSKSSQLWTPIASWLMWYLPPIFHAIPPGRALIVTRPNPGSVFHSSESYLNLYFKSQNYGDSCHQWEWSKHPISIINITPSVSITLDAHGSQVCSIFRWKPFPAIVPVCNMPNNQNPQYTQGVNWNPDYWKWGKPFTFLCSSKPFCMPTGISMRQKMGLITSEVRAMI